MYKKQLLLLMLLSFSIVGCTNVDFVNKSSLKKMGITQAYKSVSAKSFGAFSLKSGSLENNKDDSTLIVIGKQKSRFFAETMIHDRKGNKNNFIDKSYLSAGADRKNKGVMMQVRFVY
ncbi:MAG: hypothetical protein V3V18_01970 [Methylococcales bacterium]